MAGLAIVVMQLSSLVYEQRLTNISDRLCCNVKGELCCAGRPLSKTVRFNVLRVIPAGTGGKKGFAAF